MKIALIRHFPTYGNRQGRYIGVTDEPLDTEATEELIKKMRISKMEYPKADIVVASPMTRCIQTAELLYPNHEIILCHNLKECDFGLFEGKNYQELKDYPEYQRWLKSGGRTPFPKGEGREEFQNRCTAGMEKMIEMLLDQQYHSVAFVVHGGTIMSILSVFDNEKRSFYDWQAKNGEGYTARVDEDGWKKGEKYILEIEKLCFM